MDEVRRLIGRHYGLKSGARWIAYTLIGHKWQQDCRDLVEYLEICVERIVSTIPINHTRFGR